MSTEEKQHPVVAVASKIGENSRGKRVTLSTGYEAILRPVSGALISDVMSGIKDPDIPMFMNEDKGRAEPNPSDPEYLRALEEAAAERGQASIDAVIMFGVELLDPIPPHEEWVPRLKFLEKRGRLDLSGFDLSDEIDQEFVFKRYIAVGNRDFSLVGKLSGLTEEDISEAENSF